MKKRAKKMTCAQAQVITLREIRDLIAECVREGLHDHILLQRIAIALETIAKKTEGPEA